MKQAPISHQSDFTVRTYQFRELALQYFPTSTPDTASKAFRRMINACKGLPEVMGDKGYMPGVKTLPPLLVETIIKFLGEP